MWIRKANENFLKTTLREILAKMPHCVGSYNANMIVFPRILDAIASDFF